MSVDRRHDAARPAAADVLLDLPAALRLPLLRAFRRAADQGGHDRVPGRLRPYAGWKPEALTAARPGRELARALDSDAWLREAVAEQVAGAGPVAAAATADVDALTASHPLPEVVALLAVHRRWEDLAQLASTASEEQAGRRRDAELASARREAADAEEARARMEADLEDLRLQREELRRRAADAERRAETAAGERDTLREEARWLRGEVERLELALGKERDRAARKVRSAIARAERAEARARVDTARARDLAGTLSAIAADLRETLEPAVAAPAGTASAEVPTIARTTPAARPGRPCQLPPGLATDSSPGVLAVLRCPGVAVLVDGYNVTKHPRGLPQGTLEEQRRWLVGIAGGVAARFGLRVTVAFDGADVGPAQAPSARGVQVVFSKPGEIADDLIVDLVDARPRTQPLLVVTDDRDLRSRVDARAADVAGVAPFLAAVGA